MTSSNMTCEAIQNDIALWVGNDIPAAEAEPIRQHLATCPACRAQAHRLKTALAMIGRSTPEPTYDTVESLWPAIARRLPHRPRRKAESVWKKWLPSVAASVAAASVVLAVVVFSPRGEPHQPLPTAVPRGMGLEGASALETIRDQAKPDSHKKVTNPMLRRAGE